MIIGLTGGTGTGKTSVSHIFTENGYEVIDFDKVTHSIYPKDSPCLKEITDAFGNNILTPGGELDRKALGAIVFADKSMLEKLNKIVYKYILEYAMKKIELFKGKGLVLDAPTLFESGLNKKCDCIIGVIAQREKRMERIMRRDNLSAQRASQRIDSQKNDDFYRENCDFIIENNSDMESLRTQCEEIIKKLI